ncbi:MAG: MbcA/ParS/Xre antitoxin family protein [Pseudomonadota bacterium]
MKTEQQALLRDEQKVHAVLRTFFNIVAAWRLSNEQAQALLGAPSASQFYKLKKQQVSRLSRDMAERISYVLGIHKALRILLPDREMADSWVHRPNDHYLFNGQSALERMLAGNVADLAAVRSYLDAERG